MATTVQNFVDELRVSNPCCHRFGGHGNNTIDYMNNDLLTWFQELTAQSLQFLVGVLHASSLDVKSVDQSFCGRYGTKIGSHITKSEKHVQSCSCYCVVSITTNCLSLAILCECFIRCYYS